MRHAIYFCIILLVSGVFSHMPSVYEFCSHVVANGDGGRTSCDASRCHGRPGKIGPAGPRGIPGFRGDKGEPGTSEKLEERVADLEDSIKKLRNLFMKQESTKETLCYMGMKNNDIPASALTASSSWDSDTGPTYGRLDFESTYPPSGAWCSRNNRVGEWYQVDFGKSELVAGLITQGRTDYNGQWVTSFKVKCGNGTENLETVTENGVEKVFSGNTDRSTKVVNKFSNPMSCRYIQVYPQSWNNHMSMRMEFIRGECHDFY